MMSEVPVRMLIIEDYPDDALLMVNEMRRAGFEPLWEQVETREQYLRLLSPDLDVILSDYSLPTFSAPAALDLLREHDFDVPFIVVSGAISEEIAVECMKRGAADYLLKDRLARLGPAVQHALEQTQLRAEKRGAYRALRESERRFRALIEQSADAIALLDENAVIVYISPAATHILGYTPEELIGRDAGCFVHPDHFEESRRMFEKVLSIPGRPAPAELRALHKDGGVIWLEGAGTNLLDDPGVNAIVVNFRDITERVRSNDHKERLFQQVRTAQHRLQALSRRLVEVQEAERRHIASELHDEVGQLLTGLKLMLRSLSPLTIPERLQRLKDADALVNEVMARVRALSRELRPPILDQQGLGPALEGLIDRYSHQTSIHVALEMRLPDRQRFSIELETAAYRVAQEALTNAARYADVDRVGVDLWIDDPFLKVRVDDEGRGFVVPEALQRASSSGLGGLLERVHLLGGALVVESSPGAGTHILAALPLRTMDFPEATAASESSQSLLEI